MGMLSPSISDPYLGSKGVVLNRIRASPTDSSIPSTNTSRIPSTLTGDARLDFKQLILGMFIQTLYDLAFSRSLYFVKRELENRIY